MEQIPLFGPVQEILRFKKERGKKNEAKEQVEKEKKRREDEGDRGKYLQLSIKCAQKEEE